MKLRVAQVVAFMLACILNVSEIDAKPVKLHMLMSDPFGSQRLNGLTVTIRVPDESVCGGDQNTTTTPKPCTKFIRKRARITQDEWQTVYTAARAFVNLKRDLYRPSVPQQETQASQRYGPVDIWVKRYMPNDKVWKERQVRYTGGVDELHDAPEAFRNVADALTQLVDKLQTEKRFKVVK